MLFKITNSGNDTIMRFSNFAKFYLKDIEKEVEFYDNYEICLPDPEEFYRKVESFYDPIPKWMLFESKISRIFSRSSIAPFQLCFKIGSKYNYYINLEF